MHSLGSHQDLLNQGLASGVPPSGLTGPPLRLGGMRGERATSAAEVQLSLAVPFFPVLSCGWSRGPLAIPTTVLCTFCYPAHGAARMALFGVASHKPNLYSGWNLLVQKPGIKQPLYVRNCESAIVKGGEDLCLDSTYSPRRNHQAAEQ